MRRNFFIRVVTLLLVPCLSVAPCVAEPGLGSLGAEARGSRGLGLAAALYKGGHPPSSLTLNPPTVFAEQALMLAAVEAPRRLLSKMPFVSRLLSAYARGREDRSYIVFGAGTQAVAAVYDLLLNGQAAQVTLVDSE